MSEISPLHHDEWDAESETVPLGDHHELDAEAAATDLINLYLNQAGRVERLTHEEVIEHAKDIEAGLYAVKLLREAAQSELPVDLVHIDDIVDAKYGDDEEVAGYLAQDLQAMASHGAKMRRDLIAANLLLVPDYAAKKRSGRYSMVLGDLIQHGNMGLIRAVEKYDYEKGFEFSTYAVTWIRRAIQVGVMTDDRLLRLPEDKFALIIQYEKTTRELSGELGRTPDPSEVALAMDLSAEGLKKLLEYKDNEPLRLEKGFVKDMGGNDLSLADILMDGDSVDMYDDMLQIWADLQLVDELLSRLEEDERHIQEHIHGLNGKPRLTQREIAVTIGKSRDYVQRHQQIGILAMRQILGSEDDEPEDEYQAAS